MTAPRRPAAPWFSSAPLPAMMPRMRALSPVVLGALLLSAGPVLAAEGPKVGDVVEHFALKTLNPDQSGVKLLATRKVVGPAAEAAKDLVLTFGASYCEPCKAELTELKPLAARFEAANILLAAVVVDRDEEGIAKMKALTVDELALPFPVLSDRFGILSRRYQADTLPMVVVVGKDGKIRYLHRGFEKGSLDRLLAELGITR
jgi:peroxiredoxin